MPDNDVVSPIRPTRPRDASKTTTDYDKQLHDLAAYCAATVVCQTTRDAISKFGCSLDLQAAVPLRDPHLHRDRLLPT